MQDFGPSKSPRRPHGGTQVGKRVSFHAYSFTSVLVLASLVLVGLTVMEGRPRPIDKPRFYCQ